MIRFLAAAAAALLLAASPAFADTPSAPAIVTATPAADATIAAGDTTLEIVLAEEGKITDLIVTAPDGAQIVLVDWSGDAVTGTTFTFPLPGLKPGQYGVNYTIGHLTAPASVSSAYQFTVQ
jgi:methionine-rich copper-binding protein CopC